MANVRLENVKKVYEGGVVAVHEMSLEIQDKEFVVLVGPSGCGKSTTLRMIAGLEEISEGTLWIDGVVMNDTPPKDRDIAMVFQNYALYPHMSVYENMAFGLKLRKFPKEEIDRRVREAASILGIEEYLDRKPKALSGGQRQRVAVGRAIVRKPKVFLFDEPLSNLDAKLRVQMRTEISRLHRRLEATMIYVTHDQTEAMTMGQMIVLMKDGYVQQVDSPLTIYNKPKNKFAAGFIGSPSMNFFEGIIEKGRSLVFQEKGGGVRFTIPRTLEPRVRPSLGKDIILGLRPEHLYDPSTAPRTKAGTPWKVQVEVVEPMGNEIYLYFSTGKNKQQYVARIGAQSTPSVGKPFELMFDLSGSHFFDPETERAL
ncbi:MAG: sn-glycerol-3-phosphate ABC transporter ATP-binding protein UgpC [Ignavibacteriales bacterium]|nr:sn-glycerol-3-phosphate ABC transporter ATP-binding protein UgpC [Ignavibacteriales bacterium]